MTGCWFASSIWLLIAGWIMVKLLGNLTKLLQNEPSLIVTSCFSTPLCCSCLIISMKKSCRFLLLPFFSPFSLDWLPFLEHLLFWLLIVNGNSSYYIN
jgi:hypothetical protein